MKPRTINLSLKVKVPAGVDVSDAKVASLVQKMLNIGYADAAATNNDRDLDNPDAAVVVQLSFGKPMVV